MTGNIKNLFSKITKKEFRVLLAIENKMKLYEWVPIDDIIRFSKFDIKETNFILTGLAKKKLIQRNISSYEGYRIYFEAYDILALKAFVERGSINSIGGIIGVGKESRVYEASGGITDRHVVIKFHMEGKISFKHVRKKREHIEGRKHLSWLYASRLAAKKEYDALKMLYPEVRVPEPVDHNRHAIVMSFAKGKELAKTRIDEPDWFLNDILDQVKKAYNMGIIHGDLSEFNIFIDPEGSNIIDWPQYITTDHLNAKEILNRDVSNVLNYFEKKYKIKKDVQEEINTIMEHA